MIPLQNSGKEEEGEKAIETTVSCETAVTSISSNGSLAYVLRIVVQSLNWRKGRRRRGARMKEGVADRLGTFPTSAMGESIITVLPFVVHLFPGEGEERVSANRIHPADSLLFLFLSSSSAVFSSQLNLFLSPPGYSLSSSLPKELLFHHRTKRSPFNWSTCESITS